jgi:hypothetical protein
MQGVKHLIGCRCILPTLKNRDNAPLHQFVVFSIIDDKDELIEKVVNCNNCGVSHNIVGLCQSNVIEGKELSKAAMTIEDITIMLPDGVVSILKSYEKTLPDYEHVKFIIDNERAGEFISLTSEVIEDKKAGKVLHYQGLGKFIIEPYQVDEMIK